MRLPTAGSLPLLALVAAASSVQAGIFDRFNSNNNKPGTHIVVDGAAPPAPPAEPHVDAFGAIAPGGPVIAPGKPAVQTTETFDASGATATTTPVDSSSSHSQLPYDGLEYRWKMLKFRPAEFKWEAYILTGLLAFVGLSLAGKKVNEAQAIAWNKANIGVLADNFASYQVKPASVSLTRVDPATYVGHASGRRGTSGFAAKVATWPRHDIFTLAYEGAYRLYDLTYASSANTVTLDFELDAPNAPGSTKNGMNKEDFVWALVKKNYMQSTREDRFDLQAFTATSEPNALTAAAGNDEWITFSEANLLNEFFLKKANVGIVELLRDEKRAASYLRSIVISDIIKERPDELTLEKIGAVPKVRRLTVIFNLPPSSRAHESVPLMELALNLIDVLSGSNLPNEFLNKAKKRRADVYSLLLSESRKEAKDKATLEAQALKKKAEQDRLEKLTPAERRKYELKQKEKEMIKYAKKQQGKK